MPCCQSHGSTVIMWHLHPTASLVLACQLNRFDVHRRYFFKFRLRGRTFRMSNVFWSHAFQFWFISQPPHVKVDLRQPLKIWLIEAPRKATIQQILRVPTMEETTRWSLPTRSRIEWHSLLIIRLSASVHTEQETGFIWQLLDSWWDLHSTFSGPDFSLMQGMKSTFGDNVAKTRW